MRAGHERGAKRGDAAGERRGEPDGFAREPEWSALKCEHLNLRVVEGALELGRAANDETLPRLPRLRLQALLMLPLLLPLAAVALN